MKIAWLKVENFRGIKHCEIYFPEHTVLVGDNNVGKSTLLEAIDLVLGPERLSRNPPIDEHDFYAGQYISSNGDIIPIYIEILIIGLNEEQQRRFRNHIEWWNTTNKSLVQESPEMTDQQGVVPALRLGFKGNYDSEEDDFTTKTFFLNPPGEDGTFSSFNTKDKRYCGFLFLRTLRTGSRALSLEHGSLLDIILRLKEIRTHMWEDVLQELRQLPVADKAEIGLTEIFSSMQNSIRNFIVSDWQEDPHLKVSELTRTHLRRVLTVFMNTGSKKDNGSNYAAPFQHQGTGTINTLVLSLLSMIAELRQNVIFAMEEPEIAIPPHTQKCIVDRITSMSSQAIFTSHSPYVIEEFKPSQVILIKKENGVLSGISMDYPPAIKPKTYRSEFRKRFCEALLAKHILIAEGKTECDSLAVVSSRLSELYPEEYDKLEAMGIAVIDAESDTKVAPLGQFFQSLGKKVFAVFDLQTEEAKIKINNSVDYSFESPEKGFEDLVLNGTAENILRNYALNLVAEGEWPSHLVRKTPNNSMSIDDLKDSLREYLLWSKGSGKAADILAGCSKDELPEFLIDIFDTIQGTIKQKTNIINEELERTEELGEILPENLEQLRILF